MDSIVIIGLPASGKTTSGRLMAREMGVFFFDLDDMIESRYGRPIDDYFWHAEENLFRQREHETLLSFANNIPHSSYVLSVGGGSWENKKNQGIINALTGKGDLQMTQAPQHMDDVVGCLKNMAHPITYRQSMSLIRHRMSRRLLDIHRRSLDNIS